MRCLPLAPVPRHIIRTPIPAEASRDWPGRNPCRHPLCLWGGRSPIKTPTRCRGPAVSSFPVPGLCFSLSLHLSHCLRLHLCLLTALQMRTKETVSSSSIKPMSPKLPQNLLSLTVPPRAKGILGEHYFLSGLHWNANSKSLFQCAMLPFSHQVIWH